MKDQDVFILPELSTQEHKQYKRVERKYIKGVLVDNKKLEIITGHYSTLTVQDDRTIERFLHWYLKGTLPNKWKRPNANT